jgi:hypothetical protein
MLDSGVLGSSVAADVVLDVIVVYRIGNGRQKRWKIDGEIWPK